MKKFASVAAIAVLLTGCGYSGRDSDLTGQVKQDDWITKVELAQ